MNQPDESTASSTSLDEPLVTAEHVAEILRVPRSTVYEYARRQRGALPSVGIGRHRRFVRADLERWVHAQRQT